jgi:hypothetical protein
MNFRCVPIPEQMQSLPRDPRGYPIPVIVLRDRAGKAHFTINNPDIAEKMVREDRCTICGGKLLRGRWYVGGPMSAFHPAGAYSDPAIHRECARYALQVCPHMAAPAYTNRIDIGTYADRSRAILIDQTQIAKRPEIYVAVMTTSAQVRPQLGPPYYVPKRPYLRVEYWRHGSEIAEAEAKPYLQGLEQVPPRQGAKIAIPGSRRA